MGQGPRTERSLPEVVEQALHYGRPHLQPRGTYSIMPIDEWSPQRLTLRGTTLVGQIATFLRPAQRIVAFVVTVGQRISELSSAASKAGDIVAGWALDALGSWAAESTADALTNHLSIHLGERETLSPRYSPGYCGMHLTEQAALFNLVQAKAVGVSLLPSMLMQPVKSVSGLHGVGAPGVFGAASVPCETLQRPAMQDATITPHLSGIVVAVRVPLGNRVAIHPIGLVSCGIVGCGTQTNPWTLFQPYIKQC